MLSLSRKTDYALVALTHLARCGASPQRAVSARVIADAYGLPPAMLMNLLKQLHRTGLVGSTRGASGGYFLERTPGRITVGQVVDAVEGPIQMARCCQDGKAQQCPVCAVYERCPISGSIRRMNERFSAMLYAVTLENLISGQVLAAMKQGLNGSNNVEGHCLAIVK